MDACAAQLRGAFTTFLWLVSREAYVRYRGTTFVLHSTDRCFQPRLSARDFRFPRPRGGTETAGFFDPPRRKSGTRLQIPSNRGMIDEKRLAGIPQADSGWVPESMPRVAISHALRDSA